jgi:C-terminal processing protease CtpA/Prc/Tfp pilus assembly protein PilF
MKKLANMALILAIFALSLFPAVSQELSGPERNFEHLWKTLDRNYAIFGPRHVDWQALYKVYRPRVTAQTADDELFTIMSNMLGHLNDNHVFLMSEKPKRFFSAGYLNQILGEGGFESLLKLISQRPVPDRYFKAKLIESDDKVFAHGWITDEIGYFHLNGFGYPEKTAGIIDGIIKVFKDAKALIVDVRRNGGGDDRVGKLIADRFADRKRLYMTTEIRSGDHHDQFSWKKYWHVEPAGPLQFTKTTVLLTDRTSISAAENCALAMRVLPHVTVIGDLTSGCFADMYRDRLPNGWQFSVSYKLFLDYAGFCWEGIGVPPDLKLINNKEDTEKGIDRLMELAVSLIESGGLSPQPEDGSLKGVRQSLVAQLRKDITEKGIAAAVASYHDLKVAAPDRYWVDGDEMNELADELKAAGKVSEATEVLTLLTREFPDMPLTHHSLAKLYLRQGLIKEAASSLDRSMAVNRRSYPNEIRTYYSGLLLKALYQEGLPAMAGLFRDLKAKEPDKVSETALNALGYELISIEDLKKAVQVFKLNIDLHPQYANGYDSLGEAYMKTGDKKQAIRSYEKALELNPQNDNAKEMLKKLREK